MHDLSHTGERPFSCPEPTCVYAAKSKASLTVHLRRHCKDLRYRCHVEGCDYASAARTCLVNHARKAHNCLAPPKIRAGKYACPNGYMKYVSFTEAEGVEGKA